MQYENKYTQLQFPFMSQLNLELYLLKQREAILQVQYACNIPSLSEAFSYFVETGLHDVFRKLNYDSYFGDLDSILMHDEYDK